MTEELNNEVLTHEPTEIRLTDGVNMRLTPDGDRAVADYIRAQLPPTSYAPVSDEERASVMPNITRNPDGTVTMSLLTFARVLGSQFGMYPNAVDGDKITVLPAAQENLSEE